VEGVPILRGVYGQRLCLGVLQIVSIRDPVCVAQAPILGIDPNTCPFVERYVQHLLATELLSEEPPGEGGAGGGAGGEALTEGAAKDATKKALKTKFGKKFKNGKSKRLRCTEEDATKYDCRTKWTYRSSLYKGHVVVLQEPSEITTKVKVKRSHK
jgi:hypothetical protein